MDDRQLLAIVDDEFTSAMGAPDGDISTERAKAWNYYLSKPRGDEEEGQSSVVTSDVADIVDGIMPSLLRIFTTADNAVAFRPVGPEDEEAARQESDRVNHAIFSGNDSFETLYTWFFDALTQKNGIVKAWWDTTEEVTTETYEGLTIEELSTLLEDQELEPIERAERDANQDEEPGSDGLVHDIVFRRVRKTGKLCIDNVPPEEYRVSADTKKLSLNKARMVGQEREVPRSELIEMGFDPGLVEDLPTYLQSESGRGQLGGSEERSRYDRIDEQHDSAREKSMDLIQVREVYLRVDYDGDGRAELRKITTAGNTVLENEPVDRQPFHVISPQPLPHKHFGRASAERGMDIQEVMTTLWRQTLMNLYHTNNPGHAVYDMGMNENTLDDLLTTRVGKVTRFSRPIPESYAPMTVPFTAGASLPMIEWVEKMKRDRTGVSSMGETLDADSLKHVQQGAMTKALDKMLEKIETIARIFAETGIRSLALHCHELLSKHSEKAETIQIRNQWVDVDPRRWRTRYDMRVQIGLGLGTRDSRAALLEQIFQKQVAIVQGGGQNLLVKPDDVFATVQDIVRNANLPEGRYFSDPKGQLAPPPNEEQQQLQVQQQQLVQRQQQFDAAEMRVREGKLELDRQRALLETERKSDEFKHKRQIDNAELFLKAQKIRADIANAEDQQSLAVARLQLDALAASLAEQAEPVE